MASVVRHVFGFFFAGPPWGSFGSAVVVSVFVSISVPFCGCGGVRLPCLSVSHLGACVIVFSEVRSVPRGPDSVSSHFSVCLKKGSCSLR